MTMSLNQVQEGALNGKPSLLSAEDEQQFIKAAFEKAGMDTGFRKATSKCAAG